MKHIIRRHTISFQNAIKGLLWAYQTQPNYIVHLILSLMALAGGYFFSVSYEEWLIIIVLINIGLVIETINTALEVTTDAIEKNKRDDIGCAKDVAAAAMLSYAIGALITALIIFLPKIFNLFYH